MPPQINHSSDILEYITNRAVGPHEGSIEIPAYLHLYLLHLLLDRPVHLFMSLCEILDRCLIFIPLAATLSYKFLRSLQVVYLVHERQTSLI